MCILSKHTKQKITLANSFALTLGKNQGDGTDVILGPSVWIVPAIWGGEVVVGVRRGGGYWTSMTPLICRISSGRPFPTALAGAVAVTMVCEPKLVSTMPTRSPEMARRASSAGPRRL